MKKTAIILFSIFIIAFTIYITLDTFVIKRVYVVIDNSSNKEDIINYNKEDSVEITEKSYKDNNLSIEITQYREYDTEIYVADIIFNSTNIIKTRFAENSYGKNIKQSTSDMAKDVNAIIAINGDYYGSREKGYVIRNGVLYRSKKSKNQEDLVIYEDGHFEIISEDEISAKELIEKNAKEVFSFGPGLLINGEICVTENEEVAQASTSNPRTVIGQLDNNHYIMVVSDGRTDDSKGLSLYEMAVFLKKIGVYTAYNLDGGGSSTMVFNGKVINNPVNHGSTISERRVSDIVYIGY